MSKRLNVPPFDQTPGNCGPTSLRSVLAYYGIERTEAQLIKLCRTDQTTPLPYTTPHNIVAVAEGFGLEASDQTGCTLVDLEAWMDEGTPVIVEWDQHDEGVEKGSHYSTVVQVTNKVVKLQNPEPARIVTLTRKQFEDKWIRGRAIPISLPSGGKLQRWADKKARS